VKYIILEKGICWYSYGFVKPPVLFMSNFSDSIFPALKVHFLYLAVFRHINTRVAWCDIFCVFIVLAPGRFSVQSAVIKRIVLFTNQICTHFPQLLSSEMEKLKFQMKLILKSTEILLVYWKETHTVFLSRVRSVLYFQGKQHWLVLNIQGLY
jgi:hypothetical protein